jgi:hypothetical protein
MGVSVRVEQNVIVHVRRNLVEYPSLSCYHGAELGYASRDTIIEHISDFAVKVGRQRGARTFLSSGCA